jgi:hypothetical protein
MTVSDWSETAYCDREEFKTYKEAAEQSCNSYTFERLVLNEDSPLYEEYMEIRDLE